MKLLLKPFPGFLCSSSGLNNISLVQTLPFKTLRNSFVAKVTGLHMVMPTESDLLHSARGDRIMRCIMIFFIETLLGKLF